MFECRVGLWRDLEKKVTCWSVAHDLEKKSDVSVYGVA